MKLGVPPFVWIAVVVAGLGGCYEQFQLPRDRNYVRDQFHLPADVDFIAFDSNPKDVRPEGLRIDATVAFSDEGFGAYLAGLSDKTIWRPMPFASYSPAIGEEYSATALDWRALPMSLTLTDQLSEWRLSAVDSRTIEDGKYYCSVLEMVRGEPFEDNPNAYQWHTLGRSCAELGVGSQPTVIVLGVIDSDRQVLHAVIKFSG